MNIGGALDTNILVRLLVRDDDAQTDAAAKLLQRHLRMGEALLIPVTVVLELEWVLRSRYKFSKSDVMDTFSAMLAAIELVFESEGALEQALANYEEGSADFGEYLHLALAQYGQALPFWTFEVKASKAVGARLLR